MTIATVPTVFLFFDDIVFHYRNFQFGRQKQTSIENLYLNIVALISFSASSARHSIVEKLIVDELDNPSWGNIINATAIIVIR